MAEGSTVRWDRLRKMSKEDKEMINMPSLLSSSPFAADSKSVAANSKPFVKWAGGKTQLLGAIENLLPQDFPTMPEITYIEPFVGGGAVLFYLLRKYPNITRAVINDINPHLVNAYAAIRDTPSRLIAVLTDLQSRYRSLPEEEARKEMFIDVRQKFNAGGLSREEDAAFMIFLNRTCFNGLYRENSRGEFNVAFGKYPNPSICDVELIESDSRALRRVEILHGDFSQVREYADERTFLYFDPPYRPIKSDSFTAYSKISFNDREQVRLKEFAEELGERGCRFLLSNSAGAEEDAGNNYLDILYSDFFISRVYARRSISRCGSKRGPIPELLIRNYQDTIGTHSLISTM